MRRLGEKNKYIEIIRRIQSQRGLSLLELLIALVIVSVALVAAAEMQVASISGNAFSNNATVATRLAQNKMEELKKLSNSDAALTAGDHDEGVLPGSQIFSRSYTVTDLSAELKQVTVSVSWTDKSQRTITLSTMKAK
jgi:prepilin-type N-terminal cleavage/methylation domain-containing protein